MSSLTICDGVVNVRVNGVLKSVRYKVRFDPHKVATLVRVAVGNKSHVASVAGGLVEVAVAEPVPL